MPTMIITCPHCTTVFRFGMVPGGDDGEGEGEYLAIRLATQAQISTLGPVIPRARACAPARAS